MEEKIMANRRKNRSFLEEAIAKMILEQYKPESKEDMQDALNTDKSNRK